MYYTINLKDLLQYFGIKKCRNNKILKYSMNPMHNI